MLKIDGHDYRHKVFGFIADEQLYCEMENMTEDKAESVFRNAKNIIFINKDGVSTNYSDKKLIKIFSVETPENAGVILG